MQFLYVLKYLLFSKSVSDKDSNIVEQFQLLVNGWEICKAYSELVDPLFQQANFDKQAEAAAK